MNLKTLKDTPPWDWPEDVGKFFLEVLRDEQVNEMERLLAAELAGDFTVINDELADRLLMIICNDEELESLRGQAAIALGPVACPGTDGAGTGHESQKARQKGQPRPRTLEDAAQAVY